MKRVLIIANNDAGIYLFRRELLVALDEEGFEIHIITPDTGFTARLLDLGAVLHVTDIDRRGTNPLHDISLYRSYRRLIREVSPDVILTYTIKPIVYGGVAGRKAHIPVLATITGLTSAMLGGGPMKLMLKSMYAAGLKGAACVFFQNRDNMNFMTSSGCLPRNAKTALLPGSGVDLEDYDSVPYPSEEDGLRLLAVCRLSEKKGSARLLDMIREVHSRRPDVTLDIVGGYELGCEEKYKAVIDDLVGRGAVRFTDFVSDVRPFYASCHALVHPTVSEGMSNVVQEACATARPVITSDIPGCREIYEPGKGGFGFAVDSLEDMIETVMRFVEMSREEREQMGRNAREYVAAHFDRRIVIKAYMEEIKRNCHECV